VPVEFRCATARGRDYSRAIRDDAERLLHATRLPDCEMSLTLVSDRAIRILNRDYRGFDAPTDVLSFSQLEEKGAAPCDPLAVTNRAGLPLGDVVISIDTALRQSRELGVTPASRLRTLVIHGFLHLLGYDHERSAADARRMFARERVLAAKLRGTKKTPARKSRKYSSGRDSAT
jgi:probable rRNA maturation factor